MSNPNPPKSMSKPPPPRPQRPPSPGLHSAHFELGPESDDDASDSASDSEERQSPTSISSSPLSIRRQRIYGQGKHTSSSFLSGLADSGNAFISDLQQKR
ncbi:uncharacterized protein JCM6883_003403 [Sporobolomyces salmoneus]|uniref:uncharacterized protein n=1 Tax=Sporobolomyces salmoneus TaxID=183962 RepID=UPI0031719D6F